MPRIRKKTSKRGTTNHRARIKGKVAESRKKQKRDAKKNVQWKSKHKKDPGIPSQFPYKDQILAEVAEQRRQEAEEKQRRRDEKKAARMGIPIEDVLANAGSEDDAQGKPVVFDGIGSIKGKATTQPNGHTKKAAKEDVDMKEVVPLLINRDFRNLQDVLDQADVVIQLLDSRDPLTFRSSHLEELVATKPGQKLLLVMNKIDTIPRETLSSWLAYLRTQHPTLPFRSSSAFLPAPVEQATKTKGKEKGKEKVSLVDALGASSIRTYLSQLAKEKNGDAPLVVAVTGLTNTGKSSFINSLLGTSALPIYSLLTSSLAPTTTLMPQEVPWEVFAQKIRLIDTPGLSWIPSEAESLIDLDSRRARDILSRNKGRIDRLKDPLFALEHIISRADTEDLMLLYNLPAFAKGDSSAFLSGIARSNGMVKKAGVLDLAGAARIVLRDWSTEKFPRFSLPPSTLPIHQPPTTTHSQIYSNDDEVLASVRTRREMRKGGGLVRLVAGKVETRKADVEASWEGINDESDEDEGDEDEKDEDEDEDEDDDEEMHNEDEDDSEEDEDEDVEMDGKEGDEETTLPVPTKNRKQVFSKLKAPPTLIQKKVSFAAKPKESRSAHKTGLLKKVRAKPAIKIGGSRAANISAKKVSQQSSDEGPQAYDFSRFF